MSFFGRVKEFRLNDNQKMKILELQDLANFIGRNSTRDAFNLKAKFHRNPYPNFDITVKAPGEGKIGKMHIGPKGHIVWKSKHTKVEID